MTYPFNAHATRDLIRKKDRTVKAHEGDLIVILGEREGRWGKFYVGVNDKTGVRDSFPLKSIEAVGGKVDSKYQALPDLSAIADFRLHGVRLDDGSNEKSFKLALTVGKGILNGAVAFQKTWPASITTDHGDGTYTVPGWIMAQELDTWGTAGRMACPVDEAVEKLRTMSDGLTAAAA